MTLGHQVFCPHGRVLAIPQPLSMKSPSLNLIQGSYIFPSGQRESFLHTLAREGSKAAKLGHGDADNSSSSGIGHGYVRRRRGLGGCRRNRHSGFTSRRGSRRRIHSISSAKHLHGLLSILFADLSRYTLLCLPPLFHRVVLPEPAIVVTRTFLGFGRPGCSDGLAGRPQR